MKGRLASCVALGLGLAMAGCGSDDDETPSGDAGISPGGGAGAAAAGGPGAGGAGGATAGAGGTAQTGGATGGGGAGGTAGGSGPVAGGPDGGSPDGGEPSGGDPDGSADAPGPTVVEVDCATAAIAETITTPGNFAPNDGNVTIGAGEVVELAPGAGHDATSGLRDSPDGLFAVPGGASECYRFNAAGVYPYHCTVHPGMNAELTVE